MDDWVEYIVFYIVEYVFEYIKIGDEDIENKFICNIINEISESYNNLIREF